MLRLKKILSPIQQINEVIHPEPGLTAKKSFVRSGASLAATKRGLATTKNEFCWPKTESCCSKSWLPDLPKGPEMKNCSLWPWMALWGLGAVKRNKKAFILSWPSQDKQSQVKSSRSICWKVFKSFPRLVHLVKVTSLLQRWRNINQESFRAAKCPLRTCLQTYGMRGPVPKTGLCWHALSERH